MMQAPRRATVRGPTFIRTLARLTAADVPPPARSLSDQLSQWVDWTHAVALSTALDGRPPAALLDDRILSSADDDECARVRASLTGAIVSDRAFAAATPRGPGQASAADADETLDFPFYRQRYLALQQTMEAGVGRLRERLRALLTHATPGLVRLAAVDAVMERALSRRERALLAAAPTLLSEHFERLRQAALSAAADAEGDAPTAAPSAWLDAFRKDMQNVLLAELDVRLQPAQGLLAALRTHAKN
ncbi:DUF3348 domain-containing protein [Lysobacter sp. Root690]|uniref:DUF3348 domain-containing protein n=1 Tax=Lysobacter sp. Root690 TaxID=1736588 RepID=UPI0006FB9D9A|nr:DUF3348 domain-containing protein [Lysobacter sp. Root690]KRB03250.1 hypothetical protein ASD86_20370 [Lysobacter sp. Root690]